MDRLTVKDTFLIKGRGIVAAGEVSGRGHDSRIGTTVEIIRPEWSRIVSSVCGVDTFSTCFTERVRIGILLDEAIAKEDVSLGSVITAASV